MTDTTAPEPGSEPEPDMNDAAREELARREETTEAETPPAPPPENEGKSSKSRDRGESGV